MNVEKEEYPLQDCETCGHRNVCKFVSTIIIIKDTKALPIDFDEASCLEYVEDMDMDMEKDSSFQSIFPTPEPASEMGEPALDMAYHAEEGESLGSVLQRALTTTVDELLKKGVRPCSINMNQQTMTALKEQIGSIVMSISRGVVRSVTIRNVVMPVVVDESVPTGQFYISFESV